jgi:hypothetical protein
MQSVESYDRWSAQLALGIWKHSCERQPVLLSENELM